MCYTCGGGNSGAGWTGDEPSYTPTPGKRYQWEVSLPGGETLLYDTDTQAYAAVATGGGGVRRITVDA